MCPDDLDAMDESIPFTKFTLDNLLGVVSNDKTYKHYFDCFLRAQRNRVSDGSQIETIRKDTQWEYESFRTTNGPAKLIPHVQQVKQQIQQMQPSAFGFWKVWFRVVGVLWLAMPNPADDFVVTHCTFEKKISIKTRHAALA